MNSLGAPAQQIDAAFTMKIRRDGMIAHGKVDGGTFRLDLEAELRSA